MPEKLYIVISIDWWLYVPIGLWLFGKFFNWFEIYARRNGWTRER